MTEQISFYCTAAAFEASQVSPCFRFPQTDGLCVALTLADVNVSRDADVASPIINATLSRQSPPRGVDWLCRERDVIAEKEA